MPPIAEILHEYPLLKQENAALRAQIAWLKQQLFSGGKGKKLDQAQLRLQLAELEKAEAAIPKPPQTITYERANAPKEPRMVPAETFAHLPVEETIEIIPDAVRRDPDLYERIGEGRTSRSTSSSLAW